MNGWLRQRLPKAGDGRQGMILPVAIVMIWQMVSDSRANSIRYCCRRLPKSGVAALDMLGSGELASHLLVRPCSECWRALP